MQSRTRKRRTPEQLRGIYSLTILRRSKQNQNGQQQKKERIILQGDIPTALEEHKGCRFASRCSRCQEICRSQPPQLRETEPGHYVACHCC